MNMIQKSEAIKSGLRKGFQDGSSKIAKRKCYGYEVGSDGKLTVSTNEARIVCWIFEQYLAGNSLGKIAARLEQQGILSLPRVELSGIGKRLTSYSLMKIYWTSATPKNGQCWRWPNRK